VALVLLRFIVGFGSQLVLVRLLLPEQFGQFQQVLIAVGLLGLIRTFHTGEYLIQIKDQAEAEHALDSLFSFELLQGVVVALLGLLLAGPLVRIAGGAGLERAVWLLLASFLILPFGFGATILMRELAFMRANLPGLLGTLVGPLVKISLAYLGYGFWSLLIGELVRMAFEMCLLWYLLPRKPRLVFDRAVISQAVRFGLPITLAAGVAYYYWQFDDVVVGRLLGTVSLGYYWFAFRIPKYLYQFREQLSQVTYPVLVRLDQQGQIGPGVETMMRYMAYVSGLPLLITLVFGGDLIRLLFGAVWLPALGALQILMGATALRVVVGLSVDVFKARARTSMLLLFNLMNAVMLTLLVYPLTRSFQITGTAWAVLLTLIPSSLVALIALKRLVKVRLFHALAAPIALTGGLTAIGLLLLPPAASGLWLCAYLAGAPAAFCLLALLLDRRISSELRWLRATVRQRDDEIA